MEYLSVERPQCTCEITTLNISSHGKSYGILTHLLVLSKRNAHSE